MTPPASPPALAVRLPWPYVTTNNAYFPARGRLALTPEARRYKRDVGWLTKAAMVGVWPLPGPYAVAVWYYRPPSRRRGLDVEGAHKLIVDAVCEALGVDDSLIIDFGAHKRWDAGNPRVDFILWTAEED